MKGFTQKEGIDYKETFAPVINKSSFRMLMVIAAERDLEMKHYDVKTAFLIPEIEFHRDISK